MKLLMFFLIFNSLVFSQTILSEKWYLYDRGNSPLPSNKINALIYDKLNNIYWIGCGWEFQGTDTIRGGLVRYDGINWIVYDATNSPLSNNSVTHLSLDKQNRLLIAVYGEGFHRFNGINWETFNTSNTQLPSNEIKYINIDNNNNIWVAIFGYGVAKYNGTNWILYHNANAFQGIDDVNFIQPDSLGNLWFGTEYNGLYKFDGINWDQMGEEPFKDSISMTSYALDSNLTPWFTGNRHFIGSGVLANYDNQNFTYYDISLVGYSTRLAYNSLVIDNNDNKFIGSTLGLFMFSHNVWTLYSKDNSPIPYNLFSVGTVDNHNNKIYGLRAPPPHPTGYAGLLFFNENNVTTSVNSNKYLPQIFHLYQNFPNPFNPSTIITYDLPKASQVTLSVYNLIGEKIADVVNSYQEEGKHSITFNAEKLSSGIYFYKINAGEFNSVRKMILQK